MYRDGERSKMFTRRAALLAGGQVAILAVLAGRMYQLQVVESDRYKMLADDNRINLRLLAPPRGRIYDRFGVPLAVNRENYRVLLIAEQTPDLDDTLDVLDRLIDLSAAERERVAREVSRRRSFVPVTVREDLDWREVSRIEVNAPDLPGVVIDVGQVREYPYSIKSAHILGYVAAVSEAEITGDPLLELPGFRIGKDGIERTRDLALRGKAGSSEVEVNAVGRVIRELSRSDGVPGHDIDLTIDMALQAYVLDRLSYYESAAAVLLGIETGEVLAMASTPSYEPNQFAKGLTIETWRSVISDPRTPLINKALSGLYAPGSTFKLVVTLAALESSAATPDHRVFCPGHLQLGNARFHCWKKYGHGWLDMVGAIKNSCDVYFYDLARRAGIDKIAEMARRLGLGGKLQDDLPGERAGLIPDRAWKLAATGEPWQLGETLITGIGQGFVLSTPLQLAVMAARVASGRKVVPKMVIERPDAAAATAAARQAGAVPAAAAGASPPAPFAPLGVPASALAIARTGMNAVANDKRGTAYWYVTHKDGFELAGKTGTSQVRRISKRERDTRVLKNDERPWYERDHALFVAFAPVQSPRYAVAVVVEHGGSGSSTAAPIASDILLETQKRDPLGQGAAERLAEAEARAKAGRT